MVKFNTESRCMLPFPVLSSLYQTHAFQIGGLIAHVVLFWGAYTKDSFKLGYNGSQPDPHFQAMKKYKEVPWWWYVVLLVLSFFAGRCLNHVHKALFTLPIQA